MSIPTTKEPQIKAFTIEYLGKVRTIESECGICVAFNPKLDSGSHPPVSKYKALWDTGATGTVITKKIIDELGLVQTGVAKVFHAQGEKFVSTYLINILLPNTVGFHSITVTEGVLNGIDVLIGMDIISSGDFAITHNNEGNTIFSFQVPSTNNIDFVEIFNKKYHTPIVKKQEPGRNDPCPCGSGKKYKNCCLKDLN